MEKTNEPRTPTEAQINANRENAKKSTGPRTAAGKAASSRNRLLHGLRANKHILLDEDPEDFLILLHDLYDRFQPVGDAEEMLVLRLASAHWRLDRAFPMEASLYRNRLQEIAEEDADRQRTYAWQRESAELQGSPAPPAPAPHDERDRLARAFDADCVAPNSLARLARYEGSIERSIDRCLRQLKTYQAARIASAPDRPDAGPQPSPDAGQAPPPAEPSQTESPCQVPDDPSPEVGQTIGLCRLPALPAEPAATPSESESYHSNPKNGGIARLSTAAMAQALYALLHAALEFIVALAVGQTPGLQPSRPRPPAPCGHGPRYINGHASQPDSVLPGRGHVASRRPGPRQSRYRALEGHGE
jgi:hypothetical protein